MNQYRYIILVLIRFVVGCVIMATGFYFWWVKENAILAFYTFALWLVVVVEFLWFARKIYRDFNTFLFSILQNDFTVHFKTERGGTSSMNQLYDSMNKIVQKFEQVGLEKEEQFKLLELIISHVGVGLISIDQGHKIQFMNQSFKTLSSIQAAKTVDGIKHNNAVLGNAIAVIEIGDTVTLDLDTQASLKKLKLSCTGFKTTSNSYRIISVQDIKSELDYAELIAWNKLIRVLTHEIMNSVSPISSLSGSLLHKSDKNSLTNEKLREGLSAIHSRSEGLIQFTETYRELTRLPQLKQREISGETFKKGLLPLLRSIEETSSTSKIYFDVDENVKLQIDREMMERVMINLVKNGLEAAQSVGNNPIIRIHISTHQQTTWIKVNDNGGGISPQNKEHVFVPFFTTKSGGSGIGLSLSKQIIAMHSGEIQLESDTLGVTVCITLPSG